MTRILSLIFVFELAVLLAITTLTFVSGDKKALIIRVDKKDIKKSEAIIADLDKNEQHRSEKYVPAPKQRTSLKYTATNHVPRIILDKELSYVLLRPEDAEHLKLEKSPDNRARSSKYLLIPEKDLRSHNRSQYHRSQYGVPVKHNTISVELIKAKDSDSDYDAEPERYTVRTITRTQPAKESVSIGVRSPYVPNDRSPTELNQRKLISPGVAPPLSPRSPVSPRSSPFLAGHPIPRYYATDPPFSPYPHTKHEYGPPAPNFAGPRLYHIPPPGPFRGLYVGGAPFYLPKYTPGSPAPYHYPPVSRPPPPTSSHGNAFRGGPPPKILLPPIAPKAIIKTPGPPYYLSPNLYGKKEPLPNINGQHSPTYYIETGPNSYNKKTPPPPSIGIGHTPSYYETPKRKPPQKDYIPTSYSPLRPSPPSDPADYSPPSHLDMYSNYKPKKNAYPSSYEPNSPPSHSDGPSTYGIPFKKYTPISSDYLRDKPSSYDSPSYHHKDSDSSYESPAPYNKDSHSTSYGSPIDYLKDSHSYHKSPNDHPKEIHSSYGPPHDHSKEAYISSYEVPNDHSKEIHSSYGPSTYHHDPVSSYESPGDHSKNSYKPPYDYPKDSNSPNEYSGKDDPPTYHHPPPPPSHQSFEKPSYFTEQDAIPSPGPYDPYRKPPSPQSEKHLQYPQSLEISGEMPEYHKAKKNYEPVRPPPKSSLTIKKLYPPLPPRKPAQTSIEEDNNKGNHYDHHYDHHYDYNRAPPTNDKHYDYNRGPPITDKHYDYNRAPPTNDKHYDYNRAPPTNDKHYDYNRAPPINDRHYNYNRAPPTTDKHYDDPSQYKPQPPSHSQIHSSTSFSSSAHDTHPHSGEGSYFVSPNTPSYHHLEPKHHSSEEYDEEIYHDKPTAASKSYTKSEVSSDYKPQRGQENQYKSRGSPAKYKYTSYSSHGDSTYVSEPPPSQTSTHVETVPSKPNYSSEDDDVEQYHRPRKVHKRLRLKYKPSKPYKSSRPSPQAGYSGVWHDSPLPSKSPFLPIKQSKPSSFKPSVPEARFVSSEKETHKQTSNNYNDSPDSYEESHEYPVGDSKAAIPGEPGRDYPVLSRIPATDFNCYNKPPGFYADIANRCQVYYQCSDNGAVQSFLCPNGTIFNQETFVCEWWHNVDCANSEKHFSRNNDLYKVPTPKPPKDRRQHTPQSRHTGIKKLRYSDPSINSPQPYRDRPVYRQHNRHHQAHDYKESRPSSDYEPYGAAAENKEQYVTPDSDNKNKTNVSKEHDSEEAGKPSESGSTVIFDSKRTKKRTSSELKGKKVSKLT